MKEEQILVEEALREVIKAFKDLQELYDDNWRLLKEPKDYVYYEKDQEVFEEYAYKYYNAMNKIKQKIELIGLSTKKLLSFRFEDNDYNDASRMFQNLHEAERIIKSFETSFDEMENVIMRDLSKETFESLQDFSDNGLKISKLISEYETIYRSCENMMSEIGRTDVTRSSLEFNEMEELKRRVRYEQPREPISRNKIEEAPNGIKIPQVSLFEVASYSHSNHDMSCGWLLLDKTENGIYTDDEFAYQEFMGAIASRLQSSVKRNDLVGLSLKDREIYLQNKIDEIVANLANNIEIERTKDRISALRLGGGVDFCASHYILKTCGLETVRSGSVRDVAFKDGFVTHLVPCEALNHTQFSKAFSEKFSRVCNVPFTGANLDENRGLTDDDVYMLKGSAEQTMKSIEDLAAILNEKNPDMQAQMLIKHKFRAPMSVEPKRIIEEDITDYDEYNKFAKLKSVVDDLSVIDEKTSSFIKSSVNRFESPAKITNEDLEIGINELIAMHQKSIANMIDTIALYHNPAVINNIYNSLLKNPLFEMQSEEIKNYVKKEKEKLDEEALSSEVSDSAIIEEVAESQNDTPKVEKVSVEEINAVIQGNPELQTDFMANDPPKHSEAPKVTKENSAEKKEPKGFESLKDGVTFILDSYFADYQVEGGDVDSYRTDMKETLLWGLTETELYDRFKEQVDLLDVDKTVDNYLRSKNILKTNDQEVGKE